MVNKEFKVVDTHTSSVVSYHLTRSIANRKADRLNNQYGAYRYYVKRTQPLK